MDYSVRIPPITSPETAIKVYYLHPDLGNKEITELFGKCSSATITRLKGKARDKMLELGTPVWNANRVNTQVAYEAWGLDINDLEFRYKKLQELSNTQAPSDKKIPEYF